MATWNPPNLTAHGDGGPPANRISADVNFNNIKFYQNNNLTLTFLPQAGSSGIDTCQVIIDINGVNVINDSSFRSSVDLGPYNIGGPITLIHFYGYVKSLFNQAGIDYFAEATFNQTFKVTYLNMSNDFVFVDTSINNSYIFLPIAYENARSNLLFIKDKTGNAASKNIIAVCGSNEILEIPDNNHSFTINTNWGCLTLMLDYVSGIGTWLIANNYKNELANQITQTNSEPVARYNAVFPTGISIFNTDYKNPNTGYKVDRTSGDNMIEILAPAPSGQYNISIVVYCGSAAASRGNGNALVFKTINPFGIDGFNANTYDFPYIRCDNRMKSTGIVLICDDTKWYVVGFMDNYGWEWSNYKIGADIIPSGTNMFIANGDNTTYIKTYIISTSSFIIIKNYDTTNAQYWPIVCVRNANNDYPNYYMNENYTSIEKLSDRSNRHCVWLIKEHRTLSYNGVPATHPPTPPNPVDTYHFHPVLQYNT